MIIAIASVFSLGIGFLIGRIYTCGQVEKMLEENNKKMDDYFHSFKEPTGFTDTR